jgi:hypothetical protein
MLVFGLLGGTTPPGPQVDGGQDWRGWSQRGADGSSQRKDAAEDGGPEGRMLREEGDSKRGRVEGGHTLALSHDRSCDRVILLVYMLYLSLPLEIAYGTSTELPFAYGTRTIFFCMVSMTSHGRAARSARPVPVGSCMCHHISA